MDNVKRLVTARATREGWAPDQIQYAEDYIDALYGDRKIAFRPEGLKPKYAAIIRSTFKDHLPPNYRSNSS